MVASPVRPAPHRGDESADGSPKQRHQEATPLGDADAHQPTTATGSPRLFWNATRACWLVAGLAKSRARVIARSARAVMAKVLWRCQPAHERTSYWSRPTLRPCSGAKLSSRDRRPPAIRAISSQLVFAGPKTRQAVISPALERERRRSKKRCHAWPGGWLIGQRAGSGRRRVAFVGQILPTGTGTRVRGPGELRIHPGRLQCTGALPSANLTYYGRCDFGGPR